MSSQTAEVAPPRQFGRYRLVKELGRGAMGVVHMAEDPALGRTVAIKTIALPSDPAERAEYEARFLQEARAAGSLNHPNIITIHDIGRENDSAYMALEFLEGIELSRLMSQRRLPLPMMLSIGAQIAEGLAFAHEAGIVHRDIKPANIMIVRGSQVKIMDFGIARMRKSDVKTQTGLMLGSPKYMSPEQVVGLSIDHRSDIFTLGVLLYEMASGVAPFAGADFVQLVYNVANTEPKPLNRVIPGLPDRLSAIVAKALAKDPLARYQDATQLAADLRQCAAEQGQEQSLTTRLPAASDPPFASTVRIAPEPVHAKTQRSTTSRTHRGLPPATPAHLRIELPHERQLRLEREAAQAEAAQEALPATGWMWAARYALGIVMALVLGGIIGQIELFARVDISRYDLTAADIARFLGFGAALALLGYMGLRAARQLCDIGGNAERLGAVLRPLTALVMASAGYRVSLILMDPVLSHHARNVHDWIFVLSIAGAALWLAVTIFQQSDRLNALFNLQPKTPGSTCNACGAAHSTQGKFCATCGAVRPGK
ncbi:MAG: serine/threonine-protein kinase [Burkholderiales bacterium]